MGAKRSGLSQWRNRLPHRSKGVVGSFLTSGSDQRKGGEKMQRLLLVVSVALVVAMMVVATAAPAFAFKPGNCFHTGGGPPHGCGVQSNGSANS